MDRILSSLLTILRFLLARAMTPQNRLLILLLVPYVIAYEWSARPGVDRHAIAGLWKLTPRTVPMKEFTVYPKSPQPSAPPQVLLMLKEDGSFQRFELQQDDDNNNVNIDDSWRQFVKGGTSETAVFAAVDKGVWDFVDGKLILAADRPNEQERKKDFVRLKQKQEVEDTLLVGRVVASYDNKQETTKKESTTTTTPDAHLSVPKGSVKVGKFFYPKNHPSFFEQPMFQPVRRGAFTLQQVLGSFSTSEPSQLIEKFKCSDFYNKTFFLTSHPLRTRPPKGKKRWSVKYNQFVYDPPSKEAQRAAEEEAKAVPIRVMKVRFFGNNTFSTVAGLGDAVLRGKFDVIGNDRDQLWMQVWRFGFGRSVSGSVYSEGRFLTHEDAKTYWGTIHQVVNETANAKTDGNDESLQTEGPKQLEVTGSVIFGWGLEPMPVARFIMRETSANDVMDEEDDDDDEEVDEDEDDIQFRNLEDAAQLVEHDGIDVDEDNENSFQ